MRKPIKSKLIYNGWRIAFDEESSGSFGNDFTRYVVVVFLNVFNNSSSFQKDNRQNNFLVLGKGRTDGI